MKIYRKETQIPERITNEMHLVLKFISSEGQIQDKFMKGESQMAERR